jgi:hypothetical protein
VRLDSLAEFVVSGTQFSLTLPLVGGTYKGEISADGKTITGTLTQDDSLPLVFTRTVHPATSATDKPPLSNSQWVHFGPDRKLVYATTPKGDRIPDFSSAGYRGGGVALPHDTGSIGSGCNVHSQISQHSRSC